MRGNKKHLVIAATVATATCLATLTSAKPQADIDDHDFQFTGPEFEFDCPEPNGLFADSQQCDLYYECNSGVATAKLCKDGYLFDDSKRNYEQCKLPHDVDCGEREYVQARQEGIDDRCERANGLFDHEDPAVCDKFYTCDNGTVHEMPCIPTLVFDVAIGSCVRPEEASKDAKKCEGTGQVELKSIDGFTCPGKELIGPQGILQAHPVLPHPTDCRYFFTCYFGKDPNKFGCSEGQVFDADSQICKDAEEVADCACWYGCEEDSACPDSCNADCSCPTL